MAHLEALKLEGLSAKRIMNRIAWVSLAKNSLSGTSLLLPAAARRPGGLRAEPYNIVDLTLFHRHLSAHLQLDSTPQDYSFRRQMDRRRGAEAVFGIGGGKKVSQESERNLNIARDLCQRRKPYEALPYLQKAMKDKRNIDAGIELAFLAPNKKECVKILEEAAERGKEILLTDWLGPDAFDDDGPHVGHFWGLLETRPYMRALAALGRMYFETEEYIKSTATYIEMLRLNPGDNQGVRTSVGSSLIRDGRYADALYFAQKWLENTLGDCLPMARGGTDFGEPSKALYTPEVEAKLSDCWSGEMVHTAALASFRLWGDCDLSKQYLRIAAKITPYILLRVLGKITRPTELNMYPRSPNSPEEAHDYLWLSQDLWMEEDVWDWADNNPDAKQVILKNCSNEVQGCRTREGEVAQFKRCSACRLVSYCSVSCQKAHWPQHKAVCKQQQELKAHAKAFARPDKPTKARK